VPVDFDCRKTLYLDKEGIPRCRAADEKHITCYAVAEQWLADRAAQAD